MTELAPAQVHDGAAACGLDPDTGGLTPPTDRNRRGVFLTDVILELGLASEDQLEVADKTSRESEQPIEDVLLENGTLDHGQLARAVAERNGLDYVDLESFDVDMSAAELIGRSVAERYEAVPIAFAPDGALVVAVHDVFDTLGVSDISELTRSEVRRVVVTSDQIHPLIDRLPADALVPPSPAAAEDDAAGAEAESQGAAADSEGAGAEFEPAPEADVTDAPEQPQPPAFAPAVPTDPPPTEVAAPPVDVGPPPSLGEPVEETEESLAVDQEPVAEEEPVAEVEPVAEMEPDQETAFEPFEPIESVEPVEAVEPFESLEPADQEPEPVEAESFEPEPPPGPPPLDIGPPPFRPVEEVSDPDPVVESEPEVVVEPESDPDPDPVLEIEPADQEPEPVEAESFGTEREPDPTAVPADAELAELTAELRALREIAGRADALAVSVGNRIGGLEDAAGRVDRLEHERDERDERIAQLQRDLDAAKATSVELEGRLSGVGDAAEELNAATETLRQLQQALEQTAR